MREITDGAGKVEQEFEGDEVINGVTKRIICPDGKVKEYRKTNTGGYWTNYNPSDTRYKIREESKTCPACKVKLDRMDEWFVNTTGKCDKCNREKK